MTRTLLVMRHGKSRWDEENVDDLHRSLAKRGKRDSVRIGEEICAQGPMPDIILSSPAKRARSTVRRVIGGSGYSGEVTYDPDLYFEGAESCLRELSALPDWVRVAMVVGHNPVLEELVDLLTGQLIHLATCALVHIDLPIDTWADLDDSAEGVLRQLVLPRELNRR